MSRGWRALRAACLLALAIVAPRAAWSQCLEWSTGFGPPNGTDLTIFALAAFDDGTGSALYAGGAFADAGGTPADHIARWNGTSWSIVDGGTNGVLNALVVADVGGGARLYAAGDFLTAGLVAAIRVASWDGTTWAPLGAGVGGRIIAMTAFDDGSGEAVYVAGEFSTAGGAPANRIAKWNGTTWSAVGGGLGSGTPADIVYALGVFDDGTGPALYAAGGFFMTSPSGFVKSIAKWTGSSWVPLGTGISGYVYALASFNDGTGSALYAAGNISAAGGVPLRNIARWNGTSWSALAAGVTNHVFTLTVFDDGSGPALFAAGDFDTAGGLPASLIAKWNGAAWSPLGSGLTSTTSGSAHALSVYDDGLGGGPDLYVGGSFTHAGGNPSAFIAEWRGCAGPGVLYCPGDGSVGPCPCANLGQSVHGCENSVTTGGALLSSIGSTSPDSVVLLVTDELPTALSIFLQGDASVGPNLFGDGLRCVGGTVKRLYTKTASASGATAAPGGVDPSITTQSAALGDTITPGSTRYYQTYYRDASVTFCPTPTGNTFNITNGLRILW